MLRTIIKTITFISVIALMVCISCLDSEWIGFWIIGVVSACWLGLMAYANGGFYDGDM